MERGEHVGKNIYRTLSIYIFLNPYVRQSRKLKEEGTRTPIPEE